MSEHILAHMSISFNKVIAESEADEGTAGDRESDAVVGEGILQLTFCSFCKRWIDVQVILTE